MWYADSEIDAAGGIDEARRVAAEFGHAAVAIRDARLAGMTCVPGGPTIGDAIDDLLRRTVKIHGAFRAMPEAVFASFIDGYRDIVPGLLERMRSVYDDMSYAYASEDEFAKFMLDASMNKACTDLVRYLI